MFRPDHKRPRSWAVHTARIQRVQYGRGFTYTACVRVLTLVDRIESYRKSFFSCAVLCSHSARSRTPRLSGTSRGPAGCKTRLEYTPRTNRKFFENEHFGADTVYGSPCIFLRSDQTARRRMETGTGRQQLVRRRPVDGQRGPDEPGERGAAGHAVVQHSHVAGVGGVGTTADQETGRRLREQRDRRAQPAGPGPDRWHGGVSSPSRVRSRFRPASQRRRGPGRLKESRPKSYRHLPPRHRP